MIWMEITKCNRQRRSASPTFVSSLPFLASIQHEALEMHNNVVLIECKNEYDAGKPASAYEIADLLGIPTALTVSIEGYGIHPFLNALFIAHYHLIGSTASVIIVASATSSVSSKSALGEVKKHGTIDNFRVVRLSLQQPARDSDTLLVIATPVNSKTDLYSLLKIENDNDLAFHSVPIMPFSTWLLNTRDVNVSPTALEKLNIQSSVSKQLKTICCDSCFNLLKKLPATLASTEMKGKGLLLVT